MLSHYLIFFATINGNQKRVDKSLALEQFGFNVEDEPERSWTPEKLAVFLTRRLNFSNNIKSPFYNKIILAPIHIESELNATNMNSWTVSTATIVSGIVSLISNNPKRDRVEMGQKHIFRGRDRSQLKSIKDYSPLRSLYLSGKDDEILNIFISYFDQVSKILWSKNSSISYINKTIGIQALFDLLKKILSEYQSYNNIQYKNWLKSAMLIDFSDNYFQASGVGRSRIRKVLFVVNNFETKLSEDDKSNLNRLGIKSLNL